MLHMERVGVRELRLNVSEVLRRVERGETLEVTSRGRPVARMVPVRPQGGMAHLIAAGLAIPPAEEGDLLDLLDELPCIQPKPGVPLPSRVLADLRSDER